MDTFLRPRSLNAMDEEIARLVAQLGCMNPVDEDYAKISDNIRILCEAREKKNDRVISKEMLVGIAANILGLLIILNYEQTGVITSKAFSMLWTKKS